MQQAKAQQAIKFKIVDLIVKSGFELIEITKDNKYCIKKADDDNNYVIDCRVYTARELEKYSRLGRFIR